MRKDIASRINEVAKGMPIVFEWESEPVIMKGWELMLTPIGDRHRLTPDRDYTIQVPVMRAVEHRKQMKDAYNRGGMDEVVRYHNTVMNKINKQ